MADSIEVLREMRDSWAELGSKAYDKYVAACDAAIRALSPAGGDPERGKNDPSWTLHDRVEFALRDAGFDYDEAFRIAMLAASPQQEPGAPHWGNLPDGFDDPELYPPTPAVESGASGQTLAGAGGALDAIYTDFCAKDNGDVPLERYPQGAVDALARAGWAVVPCDLPFAVLGDAAQAGVFETGNPKHGWDYLIARTRIGPDAARRAREVGK